MDKILIIKILYAAASIQGVFLAWLLRRTNVNQPANSILAILLILISLHLILVGFDEREFFLLFPHLSHVSWVIGTLYGPLVFLYIQKLTGTPVQYWIRMLLFLPFAIVILSLIPYFAQTAEEKRRYLDAFELASQDDFGWINQFVSVMHILFSTGNLGFYLYWERRQSEEFSSLDAIQVKWLKQFLIFLAAITMFGVIVFFARIWSVPLLEEFYRFHFIGVVFLFYWLSYKALTQPVLFGIGQIPAELTPVPAPEQAPKSKMVIADDEQLATIFNTVKATLEKEQLFLKSDLTLTELANRSGYTRNQVSQAINTQFKGNFFDFVNDFRIAEFKKQVLNPDKKHLTQVGIALESGFNSKAAFYAVFKKKTGMTPSAFLENQ